jgi:apolipoprotein N-acyltransferase
VILNLFFTIFRTLLEINFPSSGTSQIYLCPFGEFLPMKGYMHKFKALLMFVYMHVCNSLNKHVVVSYILKLMYLLSLLIIRVVDLMF